MRIAVLCGALSAFALLAACETAPAPSTAAIEAAAAKPYDYPFVDPDVATVVGTPTIYQAPLLESVPSEELELTVFEDRVIPEVLWYQDTLKYSLVAQDHEAPLVFIIAGTGAAHDSAKAKLMATAFYQPPACPAGSARMRRTSTGSCGLPTNRWPIGSKSRSST
jgi:hypothetical protein